MYQLVESIWIKNKEVQNIEFHKLRITNTFTHLYPTALEFDLLSQIDLNLVQCNEVKCRILYDELVREVQYIPYKRSNIKKLKIVFKDDIEYPFKYLVRHELNLLYAKKGSCDEIIIVKNNLLTDSYYYNLVLEHKEGEYHTPKLPLLNGTMRHKLLSENKIIEQNISIDRLRDYTKIHLINALNPLGFQSVEIKDVEF